jgi:glycosyltransferase involved in cell wall biosynthesis
MRIGVVIGRIGDIDGVSLETKKWIYVLKKMGHDVYIVSGLFTTHIVEKEKEYVIPMLSFFSPDCEWEQKRTFYFPDDDPDELLSHLDHASDVVAIQLFKWIMGNNIDVLLLENCAALPCHLSMGMGIKKLVQHTGIRTVCHDHDFFWERGERYKTPHKEIEDIVRSTFPLQFPHVDHAVINSDAKETLMQKYNIDSVVVPNVMDFNRPYGEKDDHNSDILNALGLDKDDIPLFQVTRIVERKGIETAIELIEKIDDPKVKLIITGSKADDERLGYFKVLIDLIKQKNLSSRVSFGYRRILTERGKSSTGEKIYSIPDAYSHARACTYFSTYEGFGNAFVECVLSRTPIFVNNYKPVYWSEIGSKGFKAVMLEDNILTDDKVVEMDKIIHDEKLSREIADHNYELAKKCFSYEVLTDKLRLLFH